MSSLFIRLLKYFILWLRIYTNKYLILSDENLKEKDGPYTNYGKRPDCQDQVCTSW